MVWTRAVPGASPKPKQLERREQSEMSKPITRLAAPTLEILQTVFPGQPGHLVVEEVATVCAHGGNASACQEVFLLASVLAYHSVESSWSLEYKRRAMHKLCGKPETAA